MAKDILKFLVLGDLHGIKPRIHIDLKTIDAIICPGDICGDDIRVYIKKHIKSISQYKKEIDFNDFCPKYKQKYLNFKSLQKGRKVLKYLNSLKIPIFLVPGNWDQTSNLDGIVHHKESKKIITSNSWVKIKKNLKNIYDVENKKINFMGVTFIGHGSVSAPEILDKPKEEDFLSKDLFERDLDRYKFFNKLYPKLKEYFKNTENPIIHISHNSVYNTKLDKINAPGTYAHNEHYGSIIARKLIEEFEPLICISGHIHEGYGKSKLKKTILLNSGFGDNVNTIIRINLKEKKISSIRFLGENKSIF